MERCFVLLTLRENKFYPSVNFLQGSYFMHIRDVAGDTPNTVNTSVVRTRRYLIGREVERLIEAARKHGRYGHRDGTMILIAYRHGLRACELCDLQWHQVELNTGHLHVRRSKQAARRPYIRCRATKSAL